VATTDYQLIKVQEMDVHNDDDAARVPRTFEVEARGSLIDRCITGDVLCVVGVVKARMTAAPRYGGGGGGGKKNEAGLHSLYVVANRYTSISQFSFSFLGPSHSHPIPTLVTNITPSDPSQSLLSGPTAW